MSLGAMSGMHAEQPPQPFDRRPPRRVKGTPLFFTDLVHGLVQRFHEMEAVDDQRGHGGSGG